MKDYVIAVTDLSAFRESLRQKKVEQSYYDEDNNTGRLLICKSRVFYNGEQSVSIVRAGDEIRNLISLPEVELLGEGKKITNFDSVTWHNESLYKSIYPATPIELDHEGEKIIHHPPKLHSILS